MADPFWSVVIPTRGERPRWLRVALAHVLAQNTGGTVLEILLQANGDVDPGAIAPFLLPGPTGKPAVFPERNPADLGCYGSVNAAIRRAKGRWVHVLHDDDWVDTTFYARMRAAVEPLGPEYGAANCLYTNHHEDGTTWAPPFFPKRAGSVRAALAGALPHGNPLQVAATVYRREVFGAAGYFREDMPYAADWEFALRLVQHYDWWFVPENLAHYRVHAGQESREMLGDGRARRDVLRVRGAAGRVH